MFLITAIGFVLAGLALLALPRPDPQMSRDDYRVKCGSRFPVSRTPEQQMA